jgi:hypothetical protein
MQTSDADLLKYCLLDKLFPMGGLGRHKLSLETHDKEYMIARYNSQLLQTHCLPFPNTSNISVATHSNNKLSDNLLNSESRHEVITAIRN